MIKVKLGESRKITFKTTTITADNVKQLRKEYLKKNN